MCGTAKSRIAIEAHVHTTPSKSINYIRYAFLDLVIIGMLLLAFYYGTF